MQDTKGNGRRHRAREREGGGGGQLGSKNNTKLQTKISSQKLKFSFGTIYYLQFYIVVVAVVVVVVQSPITRERKRRRSGCVGVGKWKQRWG